MSNEQHNTARLDRIEQTLDKLTHSNDDAAQRMQATEQTLARLAELLTRSYEQADKRMDRAEQLIFGNTERMDRAEQLISNCGKTLAETLEMTGNNAERLDRAEQLIFGNTERMDLSLINI